MLLLSRLVRVLRSDSAPVGAAYALGGGGGGGGVADENGVQQKRRGLTPGKSSRKYFTDGHLSVPHWD